MSERSWRQRENFVSKGEPVTLLAHLLAAAARHPAKIALRCGADAFSYEEFCIRILTTAARLRSFGVRSGDRVLICGNNTLAIPVLYFAIHALEAVAVPLPPDSPERTLAFLAEDADIRLAVTEKTAAGIHCAVITPLAATEYSECEEQVTPAFRPEVVADLLYTTGTTGRKKGVVLTQSNILSAARNITEFLGTGPDDIEVVPLPLSHSFGLGRLRCLALSGHTLVLEAGVGNGASVVKKILDVRATGLAMVPAGFDIMKRITGDSLGSAQGHLRYIEIGSAPMKRETRDWLTNLLPRTRICHHYGLTEASRAAFTEYHADAHKTGSAGRATPNVQLMACDETGRRLPSGEVGEIVVRGGMVMREYWNQPELTRETFCTEGMKTGDIGYIDADGYLFLLGRRGDVINVGGRKVSPDEVETLLCEISGVQDAGCVGVPDELLGESVKAYLVADREIGRAEVTAFLRARLEEFKIPLAIERVAHIPRTHSGKMQRHLLKNGKETAWTFKQ